MLTDRENDFNRLKIFSILISFSCFIFYLEYLEFTQKHRIYITAVFSLQDDHTASFKDQFYNHLNRKINVMISDILKFHNF